MKRQTDSIRGIIGHLCHNQAAVYSIYIIVSPDPFSLLCADFFIESTSIFFYIFLFCSAPSLVSIAVISHEDHCQNNITKPKAHSCGFANTTTGAVHKRMPELNVGTAVVNSADFFIVNVLHTS